MSYLICPSGSIHCRKVLSSLFARGINHKYLSLRRSMSCQIWRAKLPSGDPKSHSAKCPSGNLKSHSAQIALGQLKYHSASPRGIWVALGRFAPRGIWDCPRGISPRGIWDLPRAIWPPKSPSGNSNTPRLRLGVFELPSGDLAQIPLGQLKYHSAAPHGIWVALVEFVVKYVFHTPAKSRYL